MIKNRGIDNLPDGWSRPFFIKVLVSRGKQRDLVQGNSPIAHTFPPTATCLTPLVSVDFFFLGGEIILKQTYCHVSCCFFYVGDR